jgi:hypothetical protein
MADRISMTRRATQTIYCWVGLQHLTKEKAETSLNRLVDREGIIINSFIKLLCLGVICYLTSLYEIDSWYRNWYQKRSTVITKFVIQPYVWYLTVDRSWIYWQANQQQRLQNDKENYYRSLETRQLMFHSDEITIKLLVALNWRIEKNII